MMKGLLKLCRATWPKRPDLSAKEKEELALIVFPRCC